MTNINFVKKIAPLVGISILFYLITKIGLDKLENIFYELDSLKLVISLLIVLFPYQFFQVLKIKNILNFSGIGSIDLALIPSLSNEL